MTDDRTYNDRTHNEYGVMVDRRSAGLGFHLAHVHRDQQVAEQLAQGFAQTYPVEIMVRRVYVGSWQSLPAAEEATAERSWSDFTQAEVLAEKDIND